MKVLLLSLVICLFSVATTNAQEFVDVELVIAVDVSGSMSNREHELQRRGFLNAFSSPALIKAITSGPRGRIAVTYIEWAGPGLQRVLVPWQVIEDDKSAQAFRARLAAKPRSPIRGTSISSALAFSSGLFESNGFNGFRRVIDVSGDGHNRAGPDLLKTREQVLSKNIVINGLPIMLSPALQRGPDGYGLDQYFKDCVIGGPSAFVYPVLKANELGEAIRRKLILEIAGQPARIYRASTQLHMIDRKVDCEMGRYDEDDW